MPDDVDGGVSTAPLSYKPWMADADGAGLGDDHRATSRESAETLARIRQRARPVAPSRHRTGTRLLAREHRRDGRVLRAWLLPHGAAGARRPSWVSARRRRATLLREHIRVCFDCCHFAVEFEDPAVALDRLSRGRHPHRPRAAQLGADGGASRSQAPRPRRRRRAAAAIRRVHLPAPGGANDSRTACRISPTSTSRSDSRGGTAGREWRIHFHVPLFTARVR